MATFRITTPRLGSQSLQGLETSRKHALGTRILASDDDYGEAEFVYLAGVASCVLGSWVTFSADNHTAVLLAASGIGPVAIARAVCTASYYGWFQTTGKAIGKCLTQLGDNADVYITATGGSVDDASVIGDYIYNAKSAGAATVDDLFADFEINHPSVNNRVNPA
jgi:hypothetical protein